MDVLKFAMQAFGLLYAAGALFVIRSMAMSELLDRVIGAIEMKKPETKDAVRRWLLGGGAVLTGASGVSLFLASSWALPLFAANTVLQAGWLAWARTAFKPEDEEDAQGRRRTTNAALVCAAATLAVAYLWRDGRLYPFDDMPTAAASAAALLAYGCYLVWMLRWKGGSADEKTFEDYKEEARTAEEAAKLARNPQYRHPSRIRFEVHPYRYPMVDADDGRLLSHYEYLSIEDAEGIEEWHDAYVDMVIHKPAGAESVFPSAHEEKIHRERAEKFVDFLRLTYGRDNVEGPFYLPLDEEEASAGR